MQFVNVDWNHTTLICKIINDLKERLPQMEADVHIVSEEHVTAAVLEHCWSVHVWHTSASAEMKKRNINEHHHNSKNVLIKLCC